MSVPKCRDCKYLKVGETLTNRYIFYDTLKKFRYCLNEDAEIYNKDKTPNSYHVIESYEYKTSPKWCPLRNEINPNK